MKRSYRKIALYGVKWTSFSAIYVSLTSTALLLLLTRYLTKEDFGLYAIVSIVVMLGSQFVDAGLGQAVIQKDKIDKYQLSTLFWVNIILGFLVSFSTYFSSKFIALFYADTALKELLQLMSLVFVLSGVGAQHWALLQKKLEFKKLAFIDIIAQTTYLCSTLYLAYSGYGVYSLLYGSLLKAMARSVLSLAFGISLHIPQIYMQLSQVKELLSFGSFRTGAFFVNFFSGQIDSILIGKFLGIEILGVYDIFKKVAIQPVRVLTPIIHKVAYPILSKVHTDKERMSKMVFEILNTLNLMRIPIFLAIGLCAESLTYIFLDEQWHPYFRLLQILPFIFVLSTMQSFLGQAIIAAGKANWGFYFNMLMLIVNAGIVIFASQWGIYGIAIALLIRSVFMIWPRYAFMIKPLFTLSRKQYFSTMFKLLLLLVLFCIPIHLFVEYLNWKPWYDLIARLLLFTVELCVVMYVFERGKVLKVKSLIHNG